MPSEKRRAIFIAILRLSQKLLLDGSTHTVFPLVLGFLIVLILY